MNPKINPIIKIAKQAGKEILKIYQTDFEVKKKKDKSFKEGF
jgi:3'-phosphoadenosine 5'-phosphosulfate (PAPS) 3'-phosphatase